MMLLCVCVCVCLCVCLYVCLCLCVCLCVQCLNLSEEELAEREVDFVDIAFDELAEKHYKVEEVRH